MAGQLPPDVLEDLMLAEAMNPGAAPGAMPGGFNDVEEDDDNLDDLVEVDFNPGFAAVAAPGLIPRAQVAGQEENDVHRQAQDEQNDEDEDDEEEDISVSTIAYRIDKPLYLYSNRLANAPHVTEHSEKILARRCASRRVILGGRDPKR